MRASPAAPAAPVAGEPCGPPADARRPAAPEPPPAAAPEGPSPKPPRPWWRQPLAWAGFALSALAIGTLTTLFDLSAVYRSLLDLRWWSLPIAVPVFLSTCLLRGWRWQLLLRPVVRVPYGTARDVLMSGFMVNNLVPARAGELARALLLGRVCGASRRAALASIGVERLFDGIVLIAALSLLAGIFEVPPWTRRLGHLATLSIALLAGLAFWLALHHRSLFRILALALFFLPRSARQRVLAFLERFVAGTRALRSPALASAGILLSSLIWALEMVVYYVMLRGFRLPLPGWSAALAVVITNFGIAVPSAPGYVGVYEAACSGTLIALGLDKDLALSYAIGVHLLLFTCVTSTGLLLLWRLGFRLGDLSAGPTRAAPPER